MALTTARLRGDYLAIVTLGFSEVVRLVASNEIWLTNGTDGISGIPGPWRGRLTPEQFNLVYLALVVAALAVVVAMLERLRRSPYGRVLRAIRDDEQVAEVAGKHVLRLQGRGLRAVRRRARARRRRSTRTTRPTSRPTSSCRWSPSTSCWR